MNKLGQEPAFAKSAYVSTEGVIDSPQDGMSKRFYAACAAMQGLLANSNYKDTDTYNNKESFVDLCYELSDELLKQENK